MKWSCTEWVATVHDALIPRALHVAQHSQKLLPVRAHALYSAKTPQGDQTCSHDPEMRDSLTWAAHNTEKYSAKALVPSCHNHTSMISLPAT